MNERTLKAFEYDEIMELKKWLKEIPYINFPKDWNIQISPPFCGAVVRFRVKKGNADISIYLDCYDILGRVGIPYWEVYPYNDDVFRCEMNNIKELLQAIKISIKEQNNKRGKYE